MIDFGFSTVLLPIKSLALPTMMFWRNNPLIRQWCRQTSLIDELEQQKWFEKQSSDPTIKMFLVSYKDIQAVDDNARQIDFLSCGVCGLTSIDQINQRAEFSLYLEPRSQGKGFGKNALITLLTHGFLDLNLNVIWGETFDGNPAAKMFENIGFVREGTRRQFYYKKGKFIDAHLYSITKQEFLDKWQSSLPPSALSLLG